MRQMDFTILVKSSPKRTSWFPENVLFSWATLRALRAPSRCWGPLLCHSTAPSAAEHRSAGLWPARRPTPPTQQPQSLVLRSKLRRGRENWCQLPGHRHVSYSYHSYSSKFLFPSSAGHSVYFSYLNIISPCSEARIKI